MLKKYIITMLVSDIKVGSEIVEQGTPSSMCTHEITAHFTVEKMAQR